MCWVLRWQLRLFDSLLSNWIIVCQTITFRKFYDQGMVIKCFHVYEAFWKKSSIEILPFFMPRGKLRIIIFVFWTRKPIEDWKTRPPNNLFATRNNNISKLYQVSYIHLQLRSLKNKSKNNNCIQLINPIMMSTAYFEHCECCIRSETKKIITTNQSIELNLLEKLFTRPHLSVTLLSRFIFTNIFFFRKCQAQAWLLRMRCWQQCALYVCQHKSLLHATLKKYGKSNKQKRTMKKRARESERAMERVKKGKRSGTKLQWQRTTANSRNLLGVFNPLSNIYVNLKQGPASIFTHHTIKSIKILFPMPFPSQIFWSLNICFFASLFLH